MAVLPQPMWGVGPEETPTLLYVVVDGDQLGLLLFTGELGLRPFHSVLGVLALDPQTLWGEGEERLADSTSLHPAQHLWTSSTTSSDSLQ